MQEKGDSSFIMVLIWSFYGFNLGWWFLFSFPCMPAVLKRMVLLMGVDKVCVMK
jgi:hypothetical protein